MVPESSTVRRLLLNVCPASLCPFQPALPAAGRCLSQPRTLPSGSPLLLWLLAPGALQPSGPLSLTRLFSHPNFMLSKSCHSLLFQQVLERITCAGTQCGQPGAVRAPPPLGREWLRELG